MYEKKYLYFLKRKMWNHYAIFKEFKHCLVLLFYNINKLWKNLVWYVSHGCMPYSCGKTMLVWSLNTNDRKQNTYAFLKEEHEITTHEKSTQTKKVGGG